ncbi:MAG TPA: winged helix DNA-binding protein [Azospirillum sp.]|nr:winged helix DNA-binding protein [Azospirillum sp.]
MARIYEIHPERHGGPDLIQDQDVRLYLEIPRLVERMHRRFLDVLRTEMTRMGVDDVTPAGMMILLGIPEAGSSVRDLTARCNQIGSQATYTLRQLIDAGYVERAASRRDRRLATLRLSAKGQEAIRHLRRMAGSLAQDLLGDPDARQSLAEAHKFLRRLDQQWSGFIEDAEPALSECP